METSIDILEDVKGRMAQKDERVEARIEIPERTILDSVFSPPISRDVQSEIDRLDESVDNQASSPDNLGVQVEPEYLGGGGGLTTDYLFDGITKVTIPEKTTDFLKITKGNPATASWVAAMPDTQDADSVVIDVTKNRIYLHGFFAG